MKVSEIVDKLGLTVKAGSAGLDREVTGGYVSDLLSDVMANARDGDVWVTLQVHQNIVAVSTLTGIAGVILVGSRDPAEDAAESADAEGIPVLSTERTAFETVALLHDIGIEGGRRVGS
jgi:predicted transcriptional regulator